MHLVLVLKGEETNRKTICRLPSRMGKVATDDGASTSDKGVDWKARNRFLGLKWAGIGTLKVGFYDFYFKTAAGNAQDIFNDHPSRHHKDDVW